MNELIPLSVPNFIGNEEEYVAKAIKSEWVSTGGKFIEIFEQNMAQYVNSQGSVACQSGTAGLHLALKVLGIKEEDEVIVPTLTFIAAVNPVRYVNAVPVFMDVDDSLCIDMDKLESFCLNECTFTDNRLINTRSGKRVTAIIIVHVFGNLANMEKLLAIGAKFNIKIIEDATEALGSRFTDGKLRGKFAGTLGDIGVFSFNGNKIITTGGGGMIVSNNIKLLQTARYLSTQAKDDALHFVHKQIGYNYRMTNLQAALGVAQLEMLDKFIAIKRKNYDDYLHNGIKLLPFRSDTLSNRWFYCFLADDLKSRDHLITKLNNNNIQVRPIWHLIHALPPYEKYFSYRIEKAYYYQNRVINLPCSTNLTREQIKAVSEAVKTYVKK